MDKLHKKQIVNIFKSLDLFCYKSIEREALHGFKIEKDTCINLISTDGYRLIIVDILTNSVLYNFFNDLYSQLEALNRFIVSRSGIKKLISLINNDLDINIATNFNTSNEADLVDATYINYSSALPCNEKPSINRVVKSFEEKGKESIYTIYNFKYLQDICKVYNYLEIDETSIVLQQMESGKSGFFKSSVSKDKDFYYDYQCLLMPIIEPAKI